MTVAVKSRKVKQPLRHSTECELFIVENYLIDCPECGLSCRIKIITECGQSDKWFLSVFCGLYVFLCPQAISCRCRLITNFVKYIEKLYWTCDGWVTLVFGNRSRLHSADECWVNQIKRATILKVYVILPFSIYFIF